MIIAKKSIHNGIGEQRNEFKISYLKVLEAKLNMKETQIFSQVKKSGKRVTDGRNVIKAKSKCGDLSVGTLSSSVLQGVTRCGANGGKGGWQNGHIGR